MFVSFCAHTAKNVVAVNEKRCDIRTDVHQRCLWNSSTHNIAHASDMGLVLVSAVIGHASRVEVSCQI